MSRTLPVVAALCGLLLAACADEEPAASRVDGESSASAAGEPACADLWVDGATLPDPYEGCYDESGLVEPELFPCASGQQVVMYDERFYAVPGNDVNDEGSLATSKQFEKVKAQCTA